MERYRLALREAVSEANSSLGVSFFSDAIFYVEPTNSELLHFGE